MGKVTGDGAQPPLRARRHGMAPLWAGAIALAIIVIVTYFTFTKALPFTEGFQLKAQFASALNIAKGSPVRIAGVDVGKVDGISRAHGSHEAVVTMSLQQSALPLHRDATLKIRPRLFLEGNWFIDMTPGSPSAPTISSGYTIPVTQTADPVQLDQVLDALNSDTRSDLQSLLAAYGTALTHVPTPAEDATQDPLVRGKTAAQALNDAARRSPNALRNGAIVAQALGGQQQHDVSQLVSSLGRVTGALGRSEGDLQGLISNFDITLHALAVQSAALNQSVGLLPGALGNAHRALAALDTALPPIRGFATDLIPSVKELPSTISAALPWIAQARQLVTPAELGDLAHELRVAAPALGSLTPAQTQFATQLDATSRCLTHNVFPAGDVKLNDGSRSTGGEAYKEFWYGIVGLNGAGSDFDGNGAYLRLLGGSQGQTFNTNPINVFGLPKYKGGNLQGRAVLPPLGTSPADPGTQPPYKTNVSCASQALPDFNGPASHGPADGSGAAKP